MQAYDKTSNGFTTRITLAEGLEIVNHYMMDGRRFVREMTQISRESYEIKLKDGTTLLLIRVTVEDQEEQEEPREWHGTRTKPFSLHRFAADNRARCNRRIMANATPPNGGRGEWGVFKKTRSEIENATHPEFYTFCPKCAGTA